MEELRQAELFDFPPQLPHGLVYRPEFVTRADETDLLEAIAPLPFREARFQEYFAKRRVVHFHPAGRRRGLRPAATSGAFSSGPLPPFLAALQQKVADWLRIDSSGFIHALVSEYRPGAPIGWHRDKPVYGIVVGLSLAGRARMRFRPLDPQGASRRHGGARARAPFALRDARPHSVAMAAQHAAEQGAPLFDHFPHARRTSLVAAAPLTLGQIPEAQRK